MSLDGVNRNHQSVGDLLIGHASAEATHHVLFPHGEFLERHLFAAAPQSAVVQYPTDQWVEVLPVGLDGRERSSHRARSGGLSRADAMAAGIDCVQDRASDRALNQHQHLQLRVVAPRSAHQAGRASAIKCVRAHQKGGRAALKLQQAVLLAGAGRHQRPLSLEPGHPAAEQNKVGRSDSRATALQQAVALAGPLLQRRDPVAEIQGRERLGAVAADLVMLTAIRGRGSALL